MVEGMGELDAPPRHPGMIVAFDGKRRIGRELLARLVDPPSSAADNPGEDQRLSLGPAFRQSPFDEKLVGPSGLFLPPQQVDELSEPFGNSVHQTRST